jgi:DNA-directed RNA polymerase sigma subunit (sigma70/sigma32)
VHVVEKTTKMKKIERAYFAATGEDIPPAHLCEMLKITAAGLQQLKKTLLDPVYLSSLVSADDADLTLEDILEDEHSSDKLQAFEKNITKQFVESVVALLPPDYQVVIEARWLSPSPPVPAAEVAKRLGISKFTVTAREQQGFKILKRLLGKYKDCLSV